jgi:type I restriction-modification system DNA methylase subunit
LIKQLTAVTLHRFFQKRSQSTSPLRLPRRTQPTRGNAEAIIRRQLIRSGYLKAIIGLPANLFYGTDIPACILAIHKRKRKSRGWSF